MKMGSFPTILLIIFFIIFMPLSLQNTHILIADALWNEAEEFTVHGLENPHFESDNGIKNEKQVRKVSGVDESEEKETFIVEKFRTLLRLHTVHLSNPSNNVNSEFPSPSPSPSPTIEAPAPAPAPQTKFHIHPHSHPPLHHSHKNPKNLHKKQDRNEGKVSRKTLVAVLVPAGAAILIFALGFIWVCKKFRKQRKKPTTLSRIGKREEKTGTDASSKYVNSHCKVSSNSYLNSLGMDLEQQSYCIKRNSENMKMESSDHGTLECTTQEIVENSEFDNVSSSTREIMSVHEDDAELMKYESDRVNSSSDEKIIPVPVESHSSDDESFHSLVDSHSSNVRLSNASEGSLSDTSEISSPNFLEKSPCQDPSMSLSVQPQTLNRKSKTSLTSQKTQTVPGSSKCPRNSKTLHPPPPPPPPPPPASVRTAGFSPSCSYSYCSTRLAAKSSLSSTLPYISTPTKSPSSSPSSTTPSDIPPPPSPPPFPKEINYSIKTPPPLPSQFMPLGKDGAPLPKLKPLHWDKVRATPDRSMVWDKLRSSSFEFDEEMIESLFGYNTQNPIKNDDAKSKSPSPSKHILEPKRLQNLTILSKALNVTPDQVCEALEQGQGLRLQQLEAVAKMEPTKEEEAKLLSYIGDINELGTAEKFVISVLRTPFAFQRVEAMLFTLSFQDDVVHLRNSFSMLEEACKELKSSRLFLKLLEAVLKTGNRMNVGTIRGGARAFKLDALLKLSDVKGTDGKTTLLHFVVQEIIRSEGIRVSHSIMGKINQSNKPKTPQQKEEDYTRMGLDLVSGLSTELYNVKKTATLDIDVLASSVSNLSEGVKKVKNLLSEELGRGNFVNSMNEFLSYGEKVLEELKEDEDGVLLRVKEITEYFHGDVSKEEGNPLRIFVIVRDFLGMLDNVCKELRSLKIPKSPNPLAPFR